MPFPTPGDLPHPRIEPHLLHCRWVPWNWCLASHISFAKVLAMVDRNVFRERGGQQKLRFFPLLPSHDFLKRVSVLSSHETEKRA